MKKIIVDYDKMMGINIESEYYGFRYGNIPKLYISGNGVGLQWEGVGDNPKLMKLCNTIADALYLYEKELNND